MVLSTLRGQFSYFNLHNLEIPSQTCQKFVSMVILSLIKGTIQINHHTVQEIRNHICGSSTSKINSQYFFLYSIVETLKSFIMHDFCAMRYLITMQLCGYAFVVIINVFNFVNYSPSFCVYVCMYPYLYLYLYGHIHIYALWKSYGGQRTALNRVLSYRVNNRDQILVVRLGRKSLSHIATMPVSIIKHICPIINLEAFNITLYGHL